MAARRILVVDDYPDPVEVICVMVSILGHTVVGAESGAEALRSAVVFQPDVVLLDLDLPDATGGDIARTLRERCAKPPRIIALTGWTPAEALRRHLIDEGISELVMKPMCLAQMRELLDPDRVTTTTSLDHASAA